MSRPRWSNWSVEAAASGSQRSCADLHHQQRRLTTASRSASRLPSQRSPGCRGPMLEMYKCGTATARAIAPNGWSGHTLVGVRRASDADESQLPKQPRRCRGIFRFWPHMHTVDDSASQRPAACILASATVMLGVYAYQSIHRATLPGAFAALLAHV